MNAKCARLALAVLGLALAETLQAESLPWLPEYGNAPMYDAAFAKSRQSFADDWLQAMPPELEMAKPLPGDDAVADCRPSIDLKRPLALGDAVDVAFCNNPQVRAAWATIRVQAAAVGEARAAYLPTLNGSISRLQNKTRYPGDAGVNEVMRGHSAYAAFNWRLFDFGARAANRAAANALLEAAVSSREAVLQKILASTTGAYFEVLTANATLNARSESERLAEATLEATKRREARGLAANSDVLQAATALARARLATQRARGEQRKATATLALTIGLPPEAEPVVANELKVVVGDEVKSLASLIAQAKAGHPAIIAGRAQVAAAREKVESARSDGWPTLDFMTSYYENGYPNQGLQARQSNQTVIGLTLNIPVFDGFARSYRALGAEARAEQSVAQQQEVELQVLGDVVKAHADAESSLANLSAADDLLRSAEQALASSQRRYDLGAGDIRELLAGQSALAEAQQENVRCLAEWQSARLRLLASVGVLGRYALSAEGAMR